MNIVSLRFLCRRVCAARRGGNGVGCVSFIISGAGEKNKRQAALAAEVIYRLRMGEPIEAMHALLAQSYTIPRLDDIRPITEFDFTSKTTLPIAFAAFYEAVTESDIALNRAGYAVVSKAVENAISLGGDTDTNAAIAAAFAEAWDEGRSVRASGQTCAQRKPWYADAWDDIARRLTPDVLDVVRRLDEAVAKDRQRAASGEQA